MLGVGSVCGIGPSLAAIISEIIDSTAVVSLLRSKSVNTRSTDAGIFIHVLRRTFPLFMFF